jgi:hypothetical protein
MTLCFKPQRRRSNFRETSKDFKKEYATEKVTTEEVSTNIVLQILILMTFNL